MKGKHKQAQRTKNNARPSSSGRSAELLGNSSQKLFSALKDNTKYIAPNNPDFDPNIHQDFQLAIKKMNKKDPITRQKALLEFAELCLVSDVEVVKTVLPFWPRLYNILATDFDYRVREAAQQAHKAIVTSIKRNIAPYLKQIMGVWFTSCFDPHLSAANIAKANFQNAFTSAKRTEAIIFAQKEILEYIAQNIFNETPDSLFDSKNLQPDESVLKYRRIVCSNLIGYSKYIEELPADQVLETKELNQQLILSNNKFWKIANEEDKSIKASWFSVLVTLFEKVPSFVENSQKKICIAVFINLDDHDANVISLVWKAALYCFDIIPNWWNYVNVEKVILPKLWRVLKEGAFGNSVIIFPSVLSVINKIHMSNIIQNEDLYVKLLSNIKLGLTNAKSYRTSAEIETIVKTFFQCLKFVVTNNYDKYEFCSSLINDHVLPLIKNSLNNEREFSLSVFFHLALLLREWSKIKSNCCEKFETYVRDLWKSLHEIIDNSILKCKNLATEKNVTNDITKNELDKTLRIHKKLFIMLRDPYSNRQKKLTGVKFAEIEEEDTNKMKKKDTNVYDVLPECENKIDFCSNENFRDMIKKVILFCYEESDRADYTCLFINCLCDILNLFNEKHFYQYLAKIIIEKVSNDSEIVDSCHTINNVVRTWLNLENVPTDLVMNVIFHLLIYLKDEEKITILNDISEDYMVSVLELSLNLTNDSQMQSSVKKWLSSSYFKCTLNLFAQEVSKLWPPPLEKVNVLKTCFNATKTDGCHTNDEIKLEILKVFSEALLLEVSKSEHASHKPHRDNLLCIVEVLNEVFKEHNYQFVKRNYEVITGILVHLFVYNSIIDNDIQNYSVINETCILGVSSLAKILGSSSAEFTKNVTKQFVCAVTVLLEQNKCCLTGTKYLTDFIRSYITCLPISVNNITIDSRSSEEKFTSQISQLKENNMLDEYYSKYAEITSTICKLFVLTATKHCHNNIEFSVVQPCLKAEFFSGTLAFQFSSLHSKSSAANNSTIGDVYSCYSSVVKIYNIAYYLVTVINDYLLMISNCVKNENVSETSANENNECAGKENINLPQDSFQQELEKINDGMVYIVYLLTVLKSFFEHFEHVSYSWLTKEKISELESKIKKLIKEGLGTNNSSIKLAMMNKTFVCGGLWVKSLFFLFTDLMDCENVNETYNDILKFYELSDHVNQHCIVHVSQLFSKRVKFKMELYSPDAKLDEDKLSILTTYLRAHKDKKFSSDQDRIIWYWLDAILIHKKSLEVTFDRNLMECNRSQIILAATVCRFLSAISDNKIPLVTDKRIDFLMNALVSWMQSIHKTCKNAAYEEKNEYNLPICIFIYAVCELFESITKLATSTNSDDLFVEWNNISAPEIHTIILYSWKLLSESTHCRNIEQFLLLSVLSKVIISRSDFIVLVIKLDIDFWLGACADLIQSYCVPVRLTGFYIFNELSSEMVKQDSCCTVVEDMDKKLTLETLPIAVLHSDINNIITEYKYKSDEIFASHYSMYVRVHSYLLMWMIIAKMCEKAPAQVKYRYASWLKEKGYLESFLNSLVILMPETVHKNNLSDGAIKKTRELFSTEPKFTLEEKWDVPKLKTLVCRLYYLYLWLLPAFVRQWWKSLEHKEANVIDRITTKYVSPSLIMEEMKAIKTKKSIDKFSIKGYPAIKQIVATYTVEDTTMEITMQLASNHPLNIVKVDSSKAVLISNKWQTWSKQLNMYLAHQNSVIHDSLLSWKSNIDKMFEGVEECYICFSIVHSSNFQLPKQSCKTCHKKFHSLCLYRWFITSNKSSCPICRNYF